MSKYVRAIEILEAINEFFQEHDGQTVLYSDSQILSDDMSIKDAIAECLTPVKSEPPFIPHSQRRRIAFTPFTGWSGWIGPRKVRVFARDEFEARRWLNENASS
jgi:hypothetical protein